MRFDHMELTVPVGSLTATLREEIDGFYGSIFGWSGFDIDVAGRPCRLLMCGSDQFIQVLESDRPLQVARFRPPRAVARVPPGRR